jgi:hypothetical protein
MIGLTSGARFGRRASAESGTAPTAAPAVTTAAKPVRTRRRDSFVSSDEAMIQIDLIVAAWGSQAQSFRSDQHVPVRRVDQRQILPLKLQAPQGAMAQLFKVTG